MAELKEITSENITKLRLAARLTQLELGNAINYSDKAISKWERGEAVPDAHVLLKLSEIFGVTVDYILHDHKDEPLPKVKRSSVNHVSATLLAVIAVWMIAATAYITLLFTWRSYPIMFVYAADVSLIILLVFNSIWGKRGTNFFIISTLVSMLIVTVYLILLMVLGNFWQILFLIIPAVLIVLCCFKLKVKRVGELFRPKEKKSDKKSETLGQNAQK